MINSEKEIYSLLLRQDPDNLGIKTLNIETYVKKISEKSTIIRVKKNDSLCGFLSFYENDPAKQNAFISMLLVSIEFRKLGIGSFLLNTVMIMLKKKGFKYLSLEVFKDNKGAQLFYESYGFSKITESITHYKMRLTL